MSLQTYHRVWLSVHPERTESWLRERLLDGFEVHHIDGDHGNDAPQNLVLIERTDHRMVHGVYSFPRRKISTGKRKRRDVTGVARKAYEHRRDTGGWSGFTGCSGGTASFMAKAYATENGLQWPLSRIALTTTPCENETKTHTTR